MKTPTWRGLQFMLAGIVVTSTAGLAACGGDDDDPTPSATVKTSTAQASASATVPKPAGVTVADNSFSPGTVTIAKGGTVSWAWSGRNPHSVQGTSSNAKDKLKSPQLTGSGAFETNFNDAGTYEYQCGVHGAAMTGKIVVQ